MPSYDPLPLKLDKKHAYISRINTADPRRLSKIHGTYRLQLLCRLKTQANYIGIAYALGQTYFFKSLLSFSLCELALYISFILYIYLGSKRLASCENRSFCIYRCKSRVGKLRSFYKLGKFYACWKRGYLTPWFGVFYFFLFPKAYLWQAHI